jgi:hypothetical protein
LTFESKQQCRGTDRERHYQSALHGFHPDEAELKLDLMGSRLIKDNWPTGMVTLLTG